MQLISGVNTSGIFAFSAASAGYATCDKEGNDITTTYLPTSELGYNSQGEVNSINNSAIATVDTERQWFTHDSTLTHLSNSSQYALGINMSAISADLARMMGVDETVLWETNEYNGSGRCVLSEPFTNFKRLKVLPARGEHDQSTPYGFSGPWWEFETSGIISNGTSYKAFGSLTPAIFERQFWKYSVFSAQNTTTFVWAEGGQKNILTTAAGQSSTGYLTSVGIKKIVGIGRISGGI